MTRKRLTLALGTLIGIVVLALAGIGWYYAGEMEDGALIVKHEPDKRDMTVASVGDGEVTLAVNEHTDLTYGNWRAPGIYGIAWDDGYARIGRIISLTDGEVTRELTLVVGTPAPGIGVSVDGRAFDGDPAQALGLPYEEVVISAALGEFDAWFVPGDDDTWAIYTHGRGSNREESYRVMRTVADLGMPSLAITYRNDEGFSPSDSGYYDYGLSEWEDLEAAVQYALDAGAEDVVLVGYSMGGGITANFMYESDLADEVSGLVLDAPMMDFGDTISYGGERRGYPGVLTAVGKFVGSLRFGVDFGKLNYLDDRVDELDVPVLLFHGSEDRTIHQRVADRFATERSDIVTYVPVDGAGHVRSWNVDSARYDQAVEDFMTDTLGVITP